MAKASGGKTRVDFYGGAELLQKIEKAGGNVEEALIKAMKKSLEKPKQEMLDFIKQHHLTGVTEDSFIEEIEIDKGVITARIGFSVKKGGLPAIFLNVGTPKMPPTWFIDNAVDNNIDYIYSEQKKALQDALGELL